MSVLSVAVVVVVVASSGLAFVEFIAEFALFVVLLVFESEFSSCLEGGGGGGSSVRLTFSTRIGGGCDALLGSGEDGADRLRSANGTSNSV